MQSPRDLTAREASLLAGLTPATAQHVRHVLAAVPSLTLTSGKRSSERNRAVGGVQGSLHLFGRAADFAGGRESLAAGYAYATRTGAPGSHTGPTEALIHDSGSGLHLHLAW